MWKNSRQSAIRRNEVRKAFLSMVNKSSPVQAIVLIQRVLQVLRSSVLKVARLLLIEAMEHSHSLLLTLRETRDRKA